MSRRDALHHTLRRTLEKDRTIGQLQLYPWALENQDPDRQLFLALDLQTYTKHFQKPLFQLVIQRNKIKLLIYDSIQEVILEWITP